MTNLKMWQKINNKKLVMPKYVYCGYFVCVFVVVVVAWHVYIQPKQNERIAFLLTN